MEEKWFREIREILDRFQEVSQREPYVGEIPKEDIRFLDDYEFNMAKAMNRTLPSALKIAKMICVMNDVDLVKVKVE